MRKLFCDVCGKEIPAVKLATKKWVRRFFNLELSRRTARIDTADEVIYPSAPREICASCNSRIEKLIRQIGKGEGR